jgi:hypothetical protein
VRYLQQHSTSDCMPFICLTVLCSKTMKIYENKATVPRKSFSICLEMRHHLLLSASCWLSVHPYALHRSRAGFPFHGHVLHINQLCNQLYKMQTASRSYRRTGCYSNQSAIATSYKPICQLCYHRVTACTDQLSHYAFRA